MADKLISLLTGFTSTPYAPLVLFIHSYCESLFLPGAHDFLLISASLLNMKRALFFASISASGSVFGGVTGYLIGKKFSHILTKKLLPSDKFKQIESIYERFGLWGVAIGGFTPLPFKLFALASGIFEIDFLKFVLVAAITRFARFFSITFLIYKYGEKIKDYGIRILNNFSFAAVTVIIIAVLFFKYVTSKKKNEKEKRQKL